MSEQQKETVIYKTMLTQEVVAERPEYAPLLSLNSTLNHTFDGSFRIWFIDADGDLLRFGVLHLSGKNGLADGFYHFAAPDAQMIDHISVCYRIFLELTRKAWGNDMGDKP